ncbi:hypothetical protein BWQ96_05638 [Gracilariopsis chorda]|uniref:Uncharacterized protein n=1 Tax=Gracilariopsis chorda TaxID=448386 RepID=A0A2V3IS85_9FLOR|nr:hypothetical protein BWQ96_05638 [Gracilariopsis chorda]|eukprot:PXF44607.1 hypothetical protein BWQ96_05638 [Gracilariopsis chorda]
MAAVLEGMKRMGTWELFCFWRNEVLNRGYRSLFRYLADREAGHVRRGTISSRCLAAEKNLDSDIKSTNRNTVIAATRQCINQCGLDIQANNRPLAESYYEGSRCADRGITRICT